MATPDDNHVLATDVANALLARINESAQSYSHPDGLKALAEAYATVKEAMPRKTGGGRGVTSS